MLEDLLAHYRELQFTDYSYLLAEPEPRADLTPLHAAIERALLAELTRDLNLLTSLAKIWHDLDASPEVSHCEVGEQFTAALAFFDRPFINANNAQMNIA